MPLEEIQAVLRAPDVETRNQLSPATWPGWRTTCSKPRRRWPPPGEALQGPSPVLAMDDRSEPGDGDGGDHQTVSLDHWGPWFHGALGELASTVAARGVPAAGPPGGVVSNDFFSEERGEITIFIPLTNSHRSGGPRRSRVPSPPSSWRPSGMPDHTATSTAPMEHWPPTSRTTPSGVEGPIRERYLVGRLDTPDETVWRTEIGWPIFHTGPVA